MSIIDLLPLSAAAPFIAILVLLAYYAIKRAVWKNNRRRGRRNLGFCPSSAALSVVFLFAQAFVRPSLDHAIDAAMHEEVDEDDEGEPDKTGKGIAGQLRRIRRRLPIERLELKLPASAARPHHNCGKIEAGNV